MLIGLAMRKVTNNNRQSYDECDKNYENKALINQPVIPFPETTYSRLKNVVGLITLITLRLLGYTHAHYLTITIVFSIKTLNLTRSIDIAIQLLYLCITFIANLIMEWRHPAAHTPPQENKTFNY